MSEVTEPKPESVDHDEGVKKEAADSSDTKKESVDEKPMDCSDDKAEEAEAAEEEKPKLENSTQDDSAVDISINPGEKSEDAVADDEDSDSDESLPPGLLERPVEILDQKRARKKITRFSYDDEKASPAGEKKNVVDIPKGIGIPLKEHPRVEYQLSRNTVDDLKIIHKFLYGIPGANHLVKKNIREFCGFVLDKDSPQYEKKEDIIGRFTVDNLKWAMGVLDVPGRTKGKKEDMMDAFMEWSMCPKPQEKPVPGKKDKKTSAESGKKKIKVKRSAKKMENGGSTSNAATPSKKTKKSKKKSSEKSAKIKIASPKSRSKVTDDASSDDEPLERKKSPPSNSEIKKFVENLLKDADLEVLTMKVVFQHVYEKYPDHDLIDRKPFIKETVKKIIS